MADAAPGAGNSDTAAAARHLRVDDGSAGQRLDNYLLRELKGVPKTHVYRVIRSGEVRLNKGRASADARLVAGDDVRIPPLRLPQRAAPVPAPAREFTVLFEDEQLLAIDKPAGVAVHGGSGVSFGVVEQLRRARPQTSRLELVHRLDRETSGVLLLAKKRAALTALQDQFRARDTDKTYVAIVAGRWQRPPKVIDAPLRKTLDAAGERHVHVASRADDEARRAVTIVRRCEARGDFSRVELGLKTGRTHQLRVHLAHAGHAIVGDPKYGDFALNRRVARGEAVSGVRVDRMLLHALRLAFDHPADGRRVEVVAPLPAEFDLLWQAL